MNTSRTCGFCHRPVKLTLDTDERREYHCDPCDATEVILKGSDTPAWWYCGWKRKDGTRLRAPTSEEMFAGKWGWQPDRAAAGETNEHRTAPVFEGAGGADE